MLFVALAHIADESPQAAVCRLGMSLGQSSYVRGRVLEDSERIALICLVAHPARDVRDLVYDHK